MVKPFDSVKPPLIGRRATIEHERIVEIDAQARSLVEELRRRREAYEEASRPKRNAVAIRRDLLPALASIHERILGDVDLSHALEVVMILAGYLTEEASNPMGAHWHGDAPDA